MIRFPLLIIAVLALASFTNHDIPRIKGEVNGVRQGKVYLQKFQNKMYFVIDSADIVDGSFHFQNTPREPEIYGLTLDTTKGTFQVFVDNAPLTVQLDSSTYYRNSVVSGSASHDLFVAYTKQRNVNIEEFIRANPSSLVSAYVLYRFYSYRLSPDEIRSYIGLLDPALASTPYVQVLEELTTTLETVAVGKQAPDFTLDNTEGKATSLSDHLGKGYLFLDFWASWCGPCRRENPNIVNAYQQYNDKGLDILAVSLDRNRERWLGAIEADNLTWEHVSDLRFWDSEPAKLYGVRAIPANFLIDQNGIIIAKNLKGEELISFLKELLD